MDGTISGTGSERTTEIEWPGYKRNRPRNLERRPHREKMQTGPFIAWDGEGYSVDTGEHHYNLFGSSDGRRVEGESLTWRETFPLLLDSVNGINIIYGGDYDIIMMTRHMPWKVRERLFSGQPVRFDGYRMVWFRRKYLLLSEYRERRRSTVLYDVMSFFQTSFVNACREYLGDSPALDEMHAMKLRRDSFTKDDGDVIGYWRSELDHLVRLMEELRRLLAAVNIKPKGWYGPGAVASALMALHGMGQYYGGHVPEEVVDIAERAYYGGRFEQFKVGLVETVHEYDIRSAYPKAITLLPDFSKATWRNTHYDDGEHPSSINLYGLYQVSWHVDFIPHQMGPLPWRDRSGRIFYPLRGTSSWYWGIEVRECLTRSFPPHMYSIHQSWEPEGLTNWKPFRWVEDMYNDRAEMKRNGNPAQKALKLGLNSLYGKLAQSTGSKLSKSGEWTKPKWHNVLWAGWVTAYTRAMIFNSVRQQRNSLVAIETDAVFTTKPIEDIREGERLGEWEHVVISRILYIHSGVYYALSDGVWKLKSRGIEADKSKSADHWLDIFSRLPWKSVAVTMRLRRFGTDIRQPDRFARWFDHEITTVIPDAFSKRMHRLDLCPTCMVGGKSYADWFHYLVVPEALIESDWQSSTPYKFPWRTDTPYSWPDIIQSEAIELPEEIAWT